MTVRKTPGGLPSDGSGSMSGDLDMGGNDVVNVGNVDGRDPSADGSKLDGIEPNATADQTGAEIKAAYEGEADTNAFTDAEKTKLAGIESGAEANDVDSVNGQTGAVSLDPDDLDDAGTAHKFASAAELSKLAAIEALADVTDETNVVAALSGATLSDLGTPADGDKILVLDVSDGSNLKIALASAVGNVRGPGSATDESVARYDGATGKILQGSSCALNDNGTLGPVQLMMLERADHVETPAAGYGQLWIRNDTPNVLVFTDDAGTDHVIGAAGGGGAGLAYVGVQLDTGGPFTPSTSTAVWQVPTGCLITFSGLDSGKTYEAKLEGVINAFITAGGSGDGLARITRNGTSITLMPTCDRDITSGNKTPWPVRGFDRFTGLSSASYRLEWKVGTSGSANWQLQTWDLSGILHEVT